MSLEKKIYREWAFTGNESEKASINREIYKELCEKYKISRYEVENPDDYNGYPSPLTPQIQFPCYGNLICLKIHQ